jgi:hypothetical protein
MAAGNVNFGVEAAPGGNAVAYWFNTAACTADTYNVTGQCRFWYTARYLAASSTWEAPVALGAFPDGAVTARTNNAGDVAVLLPGWERSGNTGYTSRGAVARRAAAAAAFTVQTLTGAVLAGPQLGLDSAGSITLAATASQAGTTNVLAYRGSVAAALGAGELIENLEAPAELQLFAMGTGGQQMIIWTQNDGTNDVVWSAGSTSAAGPFVTRKLQPRKAGSRRTLVMDDLGMAYLYDLANRERRTWVGGLWADPEALPSDALDSATYECATVRTGDFLCTKSATTGHWLSYDSRRNLLVQAITTDTTGASLVLGVNQDAKNVGMGTPVLSAGGFALITLRNGYTALPSAAAPNGTAGATGNLWAAFLK